MEEIMKSNPKNQPANKTNQLTIRWDLHTNQANKNQATWKEEQHAYLIIISWRIRPLGLTTNNINISFLINSNEESSQIVIRN